MKITYWNDRGLGGEGKVGMVRKFMREKCIFFFFWIIETKKANWDRQQFSKLWEGSNFN